MNGERRIITPDDLVAMFDNGKFGLIGGEGIFSSQNEALTAAERIFKRLQEGIEFQAPQFCVDRDNGFGLYHCHVYGYSDHRDLGIMLTMTDNTVWAEIHRSVGKTINIASIGERGKEELTYQTWQNLHSFPEQNRRKPGRKAIIIGVYDR